MPASSAWFRFRPTAAAEAVKITGNVFRANATALVNGLKSVFEATGAHVWQEIDGAAIKPPGFTPFHLGTGPGGHWITSDVPSRPRGPRGR